MSGFHIEAMRDAKETVIHIALISLKTAIGRKTDYRIFKKIGFWGIAENDTEGGKAKLRIIAFLLRLHVVFIFNILTI